MPETYATIKKDGTLDLRVLVRMESRPDGKIFVGVHCDNSPGMNFGQFVSSDLNASRYVSMCLSEIVANAKKEE